MNTHSSNSCGLREHSLPSVSSKIYSAGNDFLLPFLKRCGTFVESPEEADFILALNSSAPDAIDRLKDIRKYSKPIAWWTIEDPNWLDAFHEQSRHADFVFTSDEACISRHKDLLQHDRVFWLPLACSPEFHYPLPTDGEVTDLVLSGNWYGNEARLWAVTTLLEPLLKAGFTLSLFCYGSFMWPEPYCRHWKGEKHYLTTAEQYRHGRIVLGLNNQRSGMDSRGKTFMTSMRTFEAVACGKPFLSAHSDAYERLGFVNGKHMVWVETSMDALAWAERLLTEEGQRIAAAGRKFVIDHHTYAHRLKRIEEIVCR